MKQEIAPSSENIPLRTESLPFSDIPGQSRLFLDYQANAPALSKYYPSAVNGYADVAKRAPEVLDAYKTDRNALGDALLDINRRYGAGEKTTENIERLRQPGSVAVVTGQQAGLFTGPLYTIYKALSVVRMTEWLRGQGINAVPVFWTASEDHDFDEVANAFFLDAAGGLSEARIDRGVEADGLPVGFIDLGDSIVKTIEGITGAMSQTAFTSQVEKLLNDLAKGSDSFGGSFSKLILKLLGKYGIVVFDPLDIRLKKLAAPVYSEAIRRSEEIVDALLFRDKELAADGYHSQVLIEKDYFPLFLHGDDRSRQSLKKTKEATIMPKNGGREYSVAELAELAESRPERFSPTVVLRPVVQDYLLPTLCYFGGGAEIAYFAQNSEVYRVMERPVTPILHRQSFTVIEAKHRRTFEKYYMSLKDLFAGRDEVLSNVVAKFINPELAKTFGDAEEKINAELNRLDASLTDFDVTLAQNLATRRRKIIYHIGALRKKTYLAQTKENEAVHRRIDSLFVSLLPHSELQERTLNISTFLNYHGEYFIDWIYQAIDLEDKGHRIIYL